ncbi:MAG: flagellar biosynthesis protein FlhB [Ignavibacteriaceae bacterium]
MAEVDGQEKTEKATGKRQTESRSEGKVAKSVELNSLAIFTTGLLMIYLTQKYIGSQLSGFAFNIFNSLDTLNVNKDYLQDFIKNCFYFLFITLAPILGALLAIGFIVNVAQVGFKVSFKVFIPKFTKFNPINGLKRIFVPTHSLIEVAKSLVKLAIIGGFTYSILSGLVLNASMLAELTITEVVNYMIEAAYNLLWKISLLYALIAAVDFFYQRYKFNKELMMTKQEVKEENKQTEGDPRIKARIRKLQYQAAKSRMMKNVPKADVVITNPTHFAVALRYDLKKDSAPRVLAKGVDELAQRIKAVAAENGVPIHEDRELARALYKFCNIGDEIPAKLFKAVAQILVYIFKLKNIKKKKSII